MAPISPARAAADDERGQDDRRMEVEHLALDLRLDHGPVDLLDDDEQHADRDHSRKAGDHRGDDEDRDDARIGPMIGISSESASVAANSSA